MTEYIKKEQAHRIIVTAFEGTNYMEDAWAYCTQKLRALPPADVVEVVRCKDCVYKIGNIDSAVRNSYDFFCLRFNSYVLGDGYCDFGEREDGG